jgi:predicted nuclease with TOPRIM domain
MEDSLLSLKGETMHLWRECRHIRKRREQELQDLEKRFQDLEKRLTEKEARRLEKSTRRRIAEPPNNPLLHRVAEHPRTHGHIDMVSNWLSRVCIANTLL